ncbi:hypothetical protein CPB83DRAFT_841135 [Crepidotus variabilis]|uniref:Uncharacterized protein n=1 Tax=Crepidotus variabilis TaxID=179855 RepID=A0A9P6E325_9AGAR|nr:hypothetical protein CPB83DRAFT_841135 [Crepidotus variabilis]
MQLVEHYVDQLLGLCSYCAMTGRIKLKHEGGIKNCPVLEDAGAYNDFCQAIQAREGVCDNCRIPIGHIHPRVIPWLEGCLYEDIVTPIVFGSLRIPSFQAKLQTIFPDGKFESLQDAVAWINQPTARMYRSNLLAIFLRAWDCFMGYALVSFGDDRDLGFGPKLARLDERDAGANLFWKSAAYHDRFLPQFAINIAVSSRVVDPTSLQRNPHSSHFSTIIWTRDAVVKQGLVLGGYDRIKLLRDGVRGELCMLKCLTKELVGIRSRFPPCDVEESAACLMQHRVLLRNEVKERTTWLAAVYDKDDSPDQLEAKPTYDSLIQSLSKVIPHLPVENPEVDAMRLAFEHILEQPKEYQKAKLRADYRNSQLKVSSAHPRLKKLVLNTDLFHSVALFYRSLVAAVTIQAERLLQFMEGFLLQGKSTLDFLSSCFDAKDKRMSFVEMEHLRLEITGEPYLPVHDLLDSGFFDCLDEAYETHLHAHIELFGSSAAEDTDCFDTAFDRYSCMLTQALLRWGRERGEGATRDDHRRSLAGFPNRLGLVLDGLFNSDSFGISFSTGLPLMCPKFYKDLTDLLCRRIISWEWLDPYAEQDDIVDHFLGYTSFLKEALLSLRPVDSVDSVFAKILSAVFSESSSLLNLVVSKWGPANRQPGRNLTDLTGSRQWARQKEIIATIVEGLMARPAGLTDKPEESLFDSHLLSDLLVLENGRALVNCLTKTVYPWWKLEASAAKVADDVVVNVIWSVCSRRSYEPAQPLRTHLRTLLRQYTSSFDSFWDGPGSHLMVVHSPVMRRHEDAMYHMMRRLVKEIAAELCNENTGAVPIPVDAYHAIFRPHQEVFAAAKNLFTAIAVASHQARDVRFNPFPNRRQSPLSPSFVQSLYQDLGVDTLLLPASDNDALAFYAPHSEESAVEGLSLGHGHVALTKRKSNNLTSPSRTPKPLIVVRGKKINL